MQSTGTERLTLVCQLLVNGNGIFRSKAGEEIGSNSLFLLPLRRVTAAAVCSGDSENMFGHFKLPVFLIIIDPRTDT